MKKQLAILGLLGELLSGAYRATQMRAILDAVMGLLQSNSVSITQIGRNMPGKADIKHKIKRVDRLCGNMRIKVEPLCTLMLLALSRANPTLFVSVDWTKIDNYQALVFAVSSRHGRSIPVYWEVIDPKEKSMKVVEIEAIERFAALVPKQIKITVLADRGFDEVAFISAVAHHFDYVIRVAKTNAISSVSLEAAPEFAHLAERLKVRGKPVDFGEVLFTRLHQFSTRVVGKWSADKLDPWFLVTNRSGQAATIVKTYAKRFDIEHAFKDWKDAHKGWQLGAILCKDPGRLVRLLIIPALAFLAMVLLGYWAEVRQLQWQFLSNSTRTKRYLALYRTGLLVYRTLSRLRGLCASALVSLMDDLSFRLEVA